MWDKFKKLIWHWRGVLITSPSVTLIVIILQSYGVLQRWEWVVYDQYIRLRPAETRDNQITIVGIDEADLKYLGQQIINDKIYAQLLTKLKARKPRVIALDVYRDLPVEPGNAELKKIFQSSNNIIGISKIVGDDTKETIPPPPGLKQIGANDLIFDSDKIIRRSFISIADPKTGNPVAGLGAYAALLYLDKEGIKLSIAPDGKTWQVGNIILNRFQKNDGPYVQADDGGDQFFINYRGSNNSFEVVSLRQVLTNQLPPNWGKDKIIFIGAISEGFKDLFITPYTLSPDNLMPGVEIHAHVTSQIINAVRYNRPLIKTWSTPIEWTWIFLWAIIASILNWQWRYIGGVKTISVIKSSILFFAAASLIVITYIALIWGWWIPVVPPMLAIMISTGAITSYIAHTAADIKKTFGRYVTDQVVATLLENRNALKLGGEKRKITILTSDLRGFTALSEKLTPEEVVKVLNFYLGYMADVITSYQGTIDEFMGDGILVLFGAPTSKEDDSERAIACALSMQIAMNQVNDQLKKWNMSPLQMGIGINTGEVVVGNIGSEKRTKYGVVGSNVNLTYRIESYTVGSQILISETTLNEAGVDQIEINSTKRVQPKGVKEPINIYDIGGIKGKYNLFLTKEVEIFVTLPEAIALQYTILEGKHIGNNTFRGLLVQLSDKGALIKAEQGTDSLPIPLSNIKLNLDHISTNNTNDDIYAKVLEKQSELDHFYINITAKPTEIEQKLNSLYQSLKSKAST